MSSFMVVKDYIQNVRKFNLKGRSVEFKIKTVPTNTDPVKWVKDAIENIVLYATSNLHPQDQVGITFCGESFKRDPGWIGFRKASDVTTNDVWEMLMKIYQSNGEALNTETFCLKVTSVRVPTGNGLGRKYNSFDEECAMKKGIVSINNRDNLCLPRALVVGKAHAKKDPNYAKVRLNRGKLQDIRTEKLLKKAGVVIPESGGSMEELKKFQEYLKKYKITVYVYEGKGREVLFEGQNEGAIYKINLLYHNNHFNVITSLTAAFCCVYYCELCHAPYDHKNKHRCGGACPCCQQSPPCEKTSAEITCDECNRKFRGPTCYEYHQKSRLCEQVRCCKLCLKTIKADRQHVCGEIFCKICSAHVPTDHQCFMQVNTGKPKMKDTLFVFYDLETRQEEVDGGVLVHQPILCVFAQRCDVCIDMEAAKAVCEKCGLRLQTVKCHNTVPPFMHHLLNLRKKFKQVIVVAHNGQAFDHQFILKYILEETKHTPGLIMRGSKIILMEIDNLKFIDSLNYFPMKLAALPRAFDLGPELKKGYFPHLFNIKANENYIGPLPALEYYSPNSMMPEDRKTFLQWYEEHKSDVFDFKTDIVEYCISDVDILTKTCLKFRNMFLKECNVDPFLEATTIASACNLVFRRNFLKPNTIGLIPKGGYRWRDNQSRIAVQWLIWEESQRGINIQNAARGQEVVINGVKVDGYCEETGQIFEFHGCYYHGHSCLTYRRDKPLHEDSTDTLNTRLERTKLKTNRLRSLGYEVIEIWECQFRKLLSDNKEIAKITENHPFIASVPLNPRDAFYGGRTGSTKLYYKTKQGEKIKYIDVCSLYPWVCKYGKFPVGHPEVFVGEECGRLNIFETEGLIKCKMLPPQDLYHPVLPFKSNNKLMFSLCRTCAETLNQGDCAHLDEERALRGTWVIDEVRKALEKGYVILEIFEIWKYQIEQYDPVTRIGGLFTEMMDKFVKMKQQASGWPSHCASQEEKGKYIEEFFNKEGIQMEFSLIVKNDGLRSLAKLMLNSFWGKLGQRENQPKTTIVRQPSELYELLTSPSCTVNHIEPINEEVLTVNWEYKEEAYDSLSTVNVVLAAYTTTQARLKLYSYLEQLGERVLYFDTDSVIFISRKGEQEPETGSSLGEMTNELEGYGPGSYITDFASGGPKMYTYRVFSPETLEESTVCKVKGIRVNFDATKKVNFESLRDMIIKDNPPVYITSQNIRRTQDHSVVTKTESKVFRTNFTKRKRIQDYDSVPYGFKRQRL